MAILRVIGRLMCGLRQIAGLNTISKCFQFSAKSRIRVNRIFVIDALIQEYAEK
jgi:hypothetical protein